MLVISLKFEKVNKLTIIVNGRNHTLIHSLYPSITQHASISGPLYQQWRWTIRKCCLGGAFIVDAMYLCKVYCAQSSSLAVSTPVFRIVTLTIQRWTLFLTTTNNAACFQYYITISPRPRAFLEKFFIYLPHEHNLRK